MATGSTTSSQVIVPEVYGDMAQAQFLGRVKVAGSAAVLQDNTLAGQPGETVHFPKWGALTDLEEPAETAALTVEQMSTDDSEATIKEAGKAVEITDRSRLVGLGDPLAEARRQFGILAARKVDASLITQAQADESAAGGGTPLAITTAATKTKLTWLDAIVPGLALFGDDFVPDEFAGIYINSAQLAEAFADDNFINASKFGSGDSPIRTGSLGLLGGINVFVTDRVAAKKILLLKNQALGLLYKQRPIVEQDRDILKRSTVLTTTLHYATKRLDDRRVGVVTLAAA